MTVLLITGGTGYIGSQTVFALLDASLTPVVLDNLPTGVQQAAPPAVNFVAGDAREVIRPGFAGGCLV